MTNQTDMQIMVTGRLSYAYLRKPYTSTNEDGKTTQSYKTHVIFEDFTLPNGQTVKAEEQVRKVKDAINAVAKAGWAQAGQVLQALKAQDRLCIHEGNISAQGQEEYADKFFISTNSKRSPRIVKTVGVQNVDCPEGDPADPYAGCYANVIVSIYCQSPDKKPVKWGKRVNAQLMGVQKVKDGSSFGGGKVAKLDEFGLAAADADGAAPGEAAEADGLL